MDEHGLVGEAAPACFWRVNGSQTASRYMNTIGLLAKKRHNGRTPDWYQWMQIAAIGHNAEGCYDTQQKYNQIQHDKDMQEMKNSGKPGSGPHPNSSKKK